MKALLLLVPFALVACAHQPAQVGLPYEYLHRDEGSLTGSWRKLHSARAQQLTIDLALGTFALTQGCLGTGGTLTRVEENEWRIGRYGSGLANEGCPPWRADPLLAPFDGERVTLDRRGDTLIARGNSGTAEFRRLRRR